MNEYYWGCIAKGSRRKLAEPFRKHKGLAKELSWKLASEGTSKAEEQ